MLGRNLSDPNITGQDSLFESEQLLQIVATDQESEITAGFHSNLNIFCKFCSEPSARDNCRGEPAKKAAQRVWYIRICPSSH